MGDNAAIKMSQFTVVADYKMLQLINQLSEVVVLLTTPAGDQSLLGYLKLSFFTRRL
jgi:hypothetical protein